MTIQPGEDDASHSFLSTLESIKVLVAELRPIIEVASVQLKQSSELLASLRGGQNNGLLFSGTVRVKGSAGAWTWSDNGYSVPFARVAWVDSGGFGPFLISTDPAMIATGPGTITTFGGDAGIVPLQGRSLSIETSSMSSAPPTLYLAVFTRMGPSGVL